MVKWTHEVNTKATRNSCGNSGGPSGASCCLREEKNTKWNRRTTKATLKVTRTPHEGHTEATRRSRRPHEPKTSGISGVLWHAKDFFHLSRCFSRRLKNAPEGPPEGHTNDPEATRTLPNLNIFKFVWPSGAKIGIMSRGPLALLTL